MKKTIPILAVAACLASLPALANSKKPPQAPCDQAKTETTQNAGPEKAQQNGITTKKNKQPAKKPLTENEKLFEEMLKSAQSGG